MNKVTKYAIQTICRIHLSENEVMTSTALAEIEGIPQGILMKVLGQLRRADLIQSHRGRGKSVGGFSLNKDIKEITIYEIVKIMENGIDISSVYEDTQSDIYSERIYDYLRKTNRIMEEELSKCSIFRILHPEIELQEEK